MPYPARTSRLTFRSWSEDDAELARMLWGDVAVARYISRGGFSDEAVLAKLDSEIGFDATHGFQYWPIFSRENSELVGCCGFHPRDVARGVLELGFHLRPAFWGKGLATEASRAVIEHAFAAAEASALFAGHHPENAGSQRTLEKLGFRRTHEELYPPTGVQHPCYVLER